MDGAQPPPADAPPARRARAWLRVALIVLSAIAIWLALAIPVNLDRTGPIGLVRLPVELLVILALALVLPRRAMRVVAIVAGVLFGALVVLKGLNIGFDAVFDRRFDVLNDWYYLGPAVGVLDDSAGRGWAVLAVIGAVILTLVLLAALPMALLSVTGAAARHRRRGLAVLVALAVVWAVCALAGIRPALSVPVAATNTSRLAWGTIDQIRADAGDRGVFARDIAVDRYASAPGSDLLAGLRGKDVLLVFVESYGRVALDDPKIARIVRPALDTAQRQLTAAGVQARSGYLVSPTFGGGSWLAHSSVQSGLWVDSQQRYDQLLSSHRLTLTRAFTRAGWDTFTDIPQMTGRWPTGQPFYGFDTLYTADDLGYQGPRYGYAMMPDQFILRSFQQRALRPGHRPVMAEIDLLSSHAPWVAPPPLLPWASVGDGSIFRTPAGTASGDPSGGVRARYARTIAYSLRTLASFAATSDDPNLVILAMGDHQPHTSVSGPDADHQVPVMLITRDASVLDRVAGWGWTPGLQPGPDAPVWRMDAVRDRILSTFGSGTGR